MKLVLAGDKLRQRQGSENVKWQLLEAVLAQVQNSKARKIAKVGRQGRQIIAVEVQYLEILQRREARIEGPIQEVASQLQVLQRLDLTNDFQTVVC